MGKRKNIEVNRGSILYFQKLNNNENKLSIIQNIESLPKNIIKYWNYKNDEKAESQLRIFNRMFSKYNYVLNYSQKDIIVKNDEFVNKNIEFLITEFHNLAMKEHQDKINTNIEYIEYKKRVLS